MNDVFIGRYQVIEEIGRGGMGIVYRCIDPALDRPVAIKVLPPKKLSQPAAVKRFLREARLCARLDHHNIIKIHDIGEEDGIYHIVMELVEGRSLRQIIEVRDTIGEIDIPHMVQIFHEACNAVAYAHDKKVIHRDIKPDNIMITPEGRVKVMDFGLAVIEDRHSLTELGQVMGTVAYFSPEQARGEAADHKSDIYSLGAVFFEMLTNQLIFQATSPGEMIAKHLTSPPPSPKIYNPAVPPEFINLIHRCLKKSPHDRFESVGDIVKILEDWVKARVLGIRPEQSSGLFQPMADQAARQKSAPSVAIPPPPPLPPSQKPQSTPPGLLISNDPQELPDSQAPTGGGLASFAPPPRETPRTEPAIKKEAMDKIASVFESGFFPDQSAENTDTAAEKPRESWKDVPSGGSFNRPSADFREHKTESREVRAEPQEVTKIPLIPKKMRAEMERKTDVIFDNQDGDEIEADGEEGENDFDRQQQQVFDKLRKDDAAIDLAGKDLGAESIPVACPRCGVENDPTRKYCNECGSTLVMTSFLAQKEALEHNQAGEELMSQEQYEEAKVEFEKAAQADSSFFEARMNLGRLMTELGDYKTARAWYREAAKVAPDNPLTYVFIGDLYRAENRREEAIEHFRQALKIDPSDTNIRNQLALLYSQNGNIDQAISEYQKIIAADINNIDAHRQLGYLYMSRDRNEEAIREFEAVIRLEPEDEQVFQALGNLYLKVGRLRNAEHVFQKALESSPEDPEAMAALGEIYERQNKTELALEQLGQAIEKDAGNVEARKRLATLYMRHNRTDLAIRELEQAVSYNPQDPELHRNIGELYLRNRQIDKALIHFEKTVSLAPDNAELHHKLGRIYTSKDHSDLSINYYKKAVELQPYNPTYREDLGMAYYTQKNYNQAISEMKKAATLDSTNEDYQKALGVIYEETNQLDLAEKQFQKIISSNPKDPMAQGMLGRVYAKQNMMSMAVLQYQKALQINPNSHLFHVYLGKAYAEQGKLDEAVQMFKKAIELVPGGASGRGSRVLAKSYADLGKVYLEKGDLRRAADVLKSALELNPNDPKSLHYMGQVLIEQKRYDDAINALGRALKALPQSAEIMRDLAYVYELKKEYTMAISVIKKSIHLAPDDVSGYEILARVLEEMGRYLEAANTLIDAAKNCPQDSDYTFWLLGANSSTQRNWNSAIEYYKKAINLNERVWFYHRDLASAYEEIGSFDLAIAQLEKALKAEITEEFANMVQVDLSRLRRRTRGRK